MTLDRRTTGRLDFLKSVPPRLWIDVPAGSVEAELIDLSLSGLRARLQRVDAIGPGEVHGARLLLPRGERTIPALEVLESRTDPDGLTVARLRANDSASRAALWLILDALRNGRASVKEEPAGRTALPRVPARGIYTEEARLERLRFAREQTGAGLHHLEETSLQAAKLTGNIEAFFAGVEVPVGLAGPLLFRGECALDLIYAPYATTEGALVASATRGANAITRAGGVTTRVLAQRMLRVPLFVFSNLGAAVLFARWVRDHTADIREQVRRVSQHAELLSVEPHVLGNMVHLKFLFETGDAAGQNMTTAATWHACQWLMNEMQYIETIRIEHFFIDANMSGDKKVNFQSFMAGRGTRVMAECFLPGRLIEEVLKVDPALLVLAHRHIMAGSLQVGMVGYNINVANTLAAIFTATGQDIACVHESALAQLYIEEVENGVYASLLLPCLIVGTVGGGTHLPRQSDLLQLMGCLGPDRADRLAEIIAGFALALDLSTLAAVASGQFVSAHERLGRNKPVRWFTQADLGPDFFTPGVQRVQGDPEAQVVAAEPFVHPLGTSILTELTARKIQKLVGLLPYRLRCRSRGGEFERRVLVKVKPLDDEVILMTHSLSAMCGERLRSAHERWKRHTGFQGTHLRELGFYAETDPRLVRHRPELYEAFRDDEREAYVLVMELVENARLMDTADDPSGWDRPSIEAALRGIAEVQAVWLGREQELAAEPWLGPQMTAARMTEMIPLFEALAVHAAKEFPEFISPRQHDRALDLIAAIPDWWQRIEALPRTLCHNDFNPRNVCLRPAPEGGLRLCAFDWELCCLHVPARDLAEFLAFVLRPDATGEEVDHYVEFHRRALEQAAQVPLDREIFRESYRLALWDFSVNRVGLYLMAHTFRHYGFMERMVRTLWTLIRLEGGLPGRSR